MTYSHVLLGINTNGKKRYGWSAGNSFSVQPRWRRPRTYELEVEQNCASLGCVYPAHGSASNMTV